MIAIRFRAETKGSFYRVLKRRVNDYFTQTAKNQMADRLILFKAVVFMTFLISSYTLILLNQLPSWTLIVLAFVFGLSSLMLAINIGHEAAHHTLFRSRIWNDAVLILTFAPLGLSGYLWKMRHTKSHHLFPNVNGCDSDIDENLILRLSPNHPWRRHFRYQHLYAPFVYMIVGVHSVLWQEFGYLFKRQLANMTDIRHPPHQYVIFAAVKTFHFGIALVLPMLVLPFPWWQIGLGYLAMTAVVSWAFVFLLGPSHYADVTAFPVVDSNGRFGHTWAEHGLLTSCDWSPHNRVAQFLSGGFNTHVCHHLFPNVSHAHYPRIAKLVEQTAMECGVRYNRLGTLAILRSHFRFLRELGRRPETIPMGCALNNSRMPLADLN